MNTTRRIRKLRATKSRGLEGIVDTIAGVLLVLGVSCSLIWLLTLSLFGILACAFGILFSVGFSALLRCQSELIRIRKMENGMPYEGQISTSLEEPIYACEKCGMILHSDTYCDGCGATIVEDAENRD